ncbi:hypothetical protein [Enterocloster citroniae]|uniref:hypothetical protein n=1 Tax=Enterocloster citroniae TaxID=358743 RepID=UPI0032C0FC82
MADFVVFFRQSLFIILRREEIETPHLKTIGPKRGAWQDGAVKSINSISIWINLSRRQIYTIGNRGSVNKQPKD